MKKGNKIGTEKFLISVPLPEQTETYTVIPHEDIIQKVENELNNANLIIESVEYSYSYGGEVALAKIYIKSIADEDMGMLFTWQNSYNKKVKFSCAIGGYIYDNNASLIGTEGLSWIRKHTGSADQEAYDVIEDLIDNADRHFQKIISEKERMKAMSLDEEYYGRVMGALYFEHELVTPNQASLIRSERKKPTHTYTDLDTLWGLYKMLMYGIENADITKWQSSQQKLHHLIMAEYAIAVEDMKEKFNWLDTALVNPEGHPEFIGSPTVIQRDEGGEPLVSVQPVMLDFSDDTQLAPNELKETESQTKRAVEGYLSEHDKQTAFEEGLDHKGELVDERQEWADKVLAEGPQDEHVGPIEMYEGDLITEVEEEVIEINEDELVEDPIKLAEEVTEVSNNVDEIEVPTEIEEEEVSKTISNNIPEELAEEESDFLEITEHEGLTIPTGVIETAAVIEKKMALLYGSVRPYTVDRQGDQINVMLEDTFESFYVTV